VGFAAQEMTLTPALSQGRGSASAADGYPLAVTRFPAAGTPWSTLVIGGAMGVRQDFYHPYARYLAAHGVHVLTFDYRGMGWSRPPGNLRSLDTDVSVWAEQDLEGMLREARGAAPNLPLTFLGHSLGGQLLGVLPGNEGVRAALTVTAGSGYYKLNDRMPAGVRIFWFVAIPALTPLFGYFPGKALRMVGDLPRGVAWQWRKWCLHPEYLLAEGDGYRSAFERVKVPIRSYSFDDDWLINRQAVDHLHTFYRAAPVERLHVKPADRGVKRIGHFGFFLPASEPTFWTESLAWLRSKVEAA
jgi:predicted alpha/beta hydrolase